MTTFLRVYQGGNDKLAPVTMKVSIVDAAGKPVVAKSAEKPRRLEDVRIEGDVPVPQVLFVTARDPRRFLEFQHGRYRKTSLQLSRESMSPARVVLVGNGPTVQHKESAP